MKVKNLRYLGLLGFLGLLGIYTQNSGFFGFFGFFSFFAMSERPDERLAENTYKAGFNAFVVALAGLSLLITALSMRSGLVLIGLFIAGIFMAVILTFVISFMVLERGIGK
ncbi:MAG: DUF3796 domain-containing protein [Candidatus Woesearchaeota archaeon]